MAYTKAKPLHNQQHERTKVVISDSRRLQTWQCSVHLLPIFTSAAILYVDFHGVYIGVNFPGMPNSDTSVLLLLQLCAKAHEIMIVASLSQIVWHAVRYELVHGQGLPFGLIGSGLSFSNLEFFFSKEFYSSIRCLEWKGTQMRRLGLLMLLLVCGLTAILAGPASAVLLVPRSQTYPAGETDFYLNGTTSQLWPDNLADDMAELQSVCSETNSALQDVCPAGGYFSTWQRWSRVTYKDPVGQYVPTFANSLSGSRFFWSTRSPTDRIPTLYTLGNPRSDIDPVQKYTWLVQTHAASATVLARLARDWWKVLLPTLGKEATQIADRNVRTSVRSAYAAVRCSGAQNVSTEDSTILFPSILGRWDWGEDQPLEVDLANVSDARSLRFQWIELPNELGAASIAGMIVMPATESGESRVVVGCSAQTGWVPTTVLTDAYTFWSGWYPYGISFGERTPAWMAGSDASTNGRVAVNKDWLDLLTPVAPYEFRSANITTLSTIESLFHAAGLQDLKSTDTQETQSDIWARQDRESQNGRTRLVEAIIANVLADGLSRAGSYRVFAQPSNTSDTRLNLYEPRRNFGARVVSDRNAIELPDADPGTYTVLRASMLITGYAFEASLSGFLAASVLVIHGIIAAFHILQLLKSRSVSRAWDSMAELIALAHNSQPSEILHNTGAGIEHWRTFTRTAYIRVRQGSSNDQLELCFDDYASYTEEDLTAEDSISIIELDDMDRTPHGSPSMSTSVPEAWTFPIESRRMKKKKPTRIRDDSESIQGLTKQENHADKELQRVQLNHLYG